MDNIDLYVVKLGDTLYNIAKRYQTTWQELMRVNNLTSTLLHIGKQLIVPGNNNQIKYYVEKGDTLYNIAQKFNIDINKLKELNNLNTNDVILGQLLIIKEK
jgi:LysM repeat protein